MQIGALFEKNATQFGVCFSEVFVARRNLTATCAILTDHCNHHMATLHLSEIEIKETK